MARVFPQKPAPIPMDADAQLRVCMAIIQAHATHLCDHLDRLFQVEVPFREVCGSKELRQHASLMTYGFLSEEADVEWHIHAGYYLCNYRPGRLEIHYPDRSGGGLCTFVIGELADRYGALYYPSTYRAYYPEAEATR